jgi:pSer/pThr/pTyr-binding forkhead associated (FHA) protein
MTASRQTSKGVPSPGLRIFTPDGRSLLFRQSFYIGRDHDCEVRVEDVHVSRRHVAVMLTDGQWSLHDLQSSNGMFVDRQRVQEAVVHDTVSASLGADGPSLRIQLENASSRSEALPKEEKSTGETMLLAGYAQRYFDGTDSEEGVGARTLMIRRAFGKVRKQQERRHKSIVAVVALLGLCAGGYAYYGHRELNRQAAVAEELFYAMKSLDVRIAEVEQRVSTTGQARSPDQVKRYMEQRRQLESTYEQFISGLQPRELTEQERLILRVTRTFGECEIAAPPEYLQEVNRYIRKWQTTGRFSRAVTLAQNLGYTKKIADELLAHNLPPQFFYLAMQESDFEPFRSGPPTRWGIAKGMWQFIPETGARYGLTIGPLSRLPRPDPGDDRHDWEKSTRAAARYLKDIYATDAQASGLLVMASYNWGEHRIIDLLRTMPSNPRERNFWKVLEKHRERVPLQTYEYVFYIVAAAVIGENPRLFGFPFDSPLDVVNVH